MKFLNNKGFSLIELLVALTILAVGLLAMAGLQTTAIKGNAHGNTISQATSWAEDRIEDIRNSDYVDINYVSFPKIQTQSIYTRETEIIIDDPMSDLKRITVTVSWVANGPHQVVLRTIVANGG